MDTWARVQGGRKTRDRVLEKGRFQVMDIVSKENFLKELDKVATYDKNGRTVINSNKALISAIDNSICRLYTDRLKNLAYVAKSFIEAASQATRGGDFDAIVAEQLQSIEYAIKLCEGQNE